MLYHELVWKSSSFSLRLPPPVNTDVLIGTEWMHAILWGTVGDTVPLVVERRENEEGLRLMLVKDYVGFLLIRINVLTYL